MLLAATRPSIVYKRKLQSHLRATVLQLVKRICCCCSKRHLGQFVTQNFRSSHQGPQHGSHPCCTSLPGLDKRNLLQPSRAGLVKVKTVGKGCDFHGLCAKIPGTASCVFVMRHIVLTKGPLQAHSGVYKNRTFQTTVSCRLTFSVTRPLTN